MSQFGGKDSKRHFTVVMGNKEHGLYVSSTPSSAARKAVTKLCAPNKSKKVEFHIREITQGSKKKIYGPYTGHIEKLKEPIELKGRVIKYKPIIKLSGKNVLKKGVMKGGGYNSILKINKNINEVLNTVRYNIDTTLMFSIINTNNYEIIDYYNIKCLGEGSYGKVFLIKNNEKEYVIKITNKNQEFFLEEPKILNSFMNRIDSRCQYKAISQGITRIQGVNIGHIIFPFKGSINLAEVIYLKFFNLIPNILRDVISCLIVINKFACHGDLRLENIVYDHAKNNSFIIDYGLSFLFPININTLNEIIIGNRQISVEIIIAYYQKLKNQNNIINNLYSQYRDTIQNTIDNFGLFWIIIESICGTNIFNIFFKENAYLIHKKDLISFNNYLNFYFNLDNQNETVLKINIKKLFKYSNFPNFRKEFIEYIRKKISADKFSFYFNNNEELYKNFMEKVLGLVKIDSTTRISKENLLQDPFFNINTRPLLPNVLINNKFRQLLPNIPINQNKKNRQLLPNVLTNNNKKFIKLLPSVPINSNEKNRRLLPNILI